MNDIGLIEVDRNGTIFRYTKANYFFLTASEDYIFLPEEYMVKASYVNPRIKLEEYRLTQETEYPSNEVEWVYTGLLQKSYKVIVKVPRCLKCGFPLSDANYTLVHESLCCFCVDNPYVRMQLTSPDLSPLENASIDYMRGLDFNTLIQKYPGETPKNIKEYIDEKFDISLHRYLYDMDFWGA